MDKKKLIGAAIEAMEGSYSPYSHFCVGAALLCSDGTIYKGANIENASYTPTVCAERVAFFRAVSEGKRDFEAIAICGGKNGVLADYCYPCGVCRQVMREFCKPEEFRILVIKSQDEYREYTLEELFPQGFGPGNMG